MDNKEKIIWHTNNCSTWELDAVARTFVCEDCDITIEIKKKAPKKL